MANRGVPLSESALLLKQHWYGSIMKCKEEQLAATSDAGIGPRAGRSDDLDESQSRLRAADPVLPEPKAARKLRWSGGRALRPEPSVCGEHSERVVPEGICDEP